MTEETATKLVLEMEANLKESCEVARQSIDRIKKALLHIRIRSFNKFVCYELTKLLAYDKFDINYPLRWFKIKLMGPKSRKAFLEKEYREAHDRMKRQKEVLGL